MTTCARSDAPKILLIEDDRAIAAGIVRGLSAIGFSVELASSGRRGEQLGRLGKFALILLTGAELAILAFLVERAGRVVSRGQLAEAALPSDGERFDRTIDSHVARIRKKLGASGARIATVWGIGYRFDAPEQP